MGAKPTFTTEWSSFARCVHEAALEWDHEGPLPYEIEEGVAHLALDADADEIHRLVPSLSRDEIDEIIAAHEESILDTLRKEDPAIDACLSAEEALSRGDDFSDDLLYALRFWDSDSLLPYLGLDTLGSDELLDIARKSSKPQQMAHLLGYPMESVLVFEDVGEYDIESLYAIGSTGAEVAECCADYKSPRTHYVDQRVGSRTLLAEEVTYEPTENPILTPENLVEWQQAVTPVIRKMYRENFYGDNYRFQLVCKVSFYSMDPDSPSTEKTEWVKHFVSKCSYAHRGNDAFIMNAIGHMMTRLRDLLDKYIALYGNAMFLGLAIRGLPEEEL